MAYVTHIPAPPFADHAGAVCIVIGDRLVLSLPSQKGCRTGCTFCNSVDRYGVRNLTVTELTALIRQAGHAVPGPWSAVELSFTGEGEPLTNWRVIREVLEQYDPHGVPLSGRLSLSGFAADKLLGQYLPAAVPTRLQVSLHCARQSIRDRLVPRSVSLAVLKRAILANECKFSEVTLNVVLQEGVNDHQEDLEALVQWAEPRWHVTLNPLLTDNSCKHSVRSREFKLQLSERGFSVECYSAVAHELTKQRIYPLMSSATMKKPQPNRIAA